MIIDDEEMVVGALQGFLELETDFDVATFLCPRTALRELDVAQPDAIIADFMMPELDGVSFLTEARRIQPLATRILLTGYADKQNAIRAINEAGLYHYIEKPWDNEHLLFVIQSAIERTRLFRDLAAQTDALAAANKELAGFRDRWMKAFL